MPETDGAGSAGPIDSAWWKEAVVYQIYPKSFNDSDGDGIGDIPGVIEKIEYLDELGVDVVWLCPVYDSPQADNGYDIRDYYSIFAEFGTMDDWERLRDELHARDMKLIMDLVLNHSSDEHEWFQKSRREEEPYGDFYHWHPGTEVDGTDAIDSPGPRDRDPPNDWGSIFAGSAWEWDETREEYYLHLFDTKQCDLNWRNEYVRRALYNVTEWWLEKGIDGFRLDAFNHIAKTPGYPDSDMEEGWIGSDHFLNGPGVHVYIRECYDQVLSKYDILTIAEAVGVDVHDAKQYLGTDGDGLRQVVQFEHIEIPYGAGKWDASDVDLDELAEAEDPQDELLAWDLRDLKEVVEEWQTELEGHGWESLYLGNHDHPRTVSRWGDDGEYREKSAKLLATYLFTLRGSPFIYQGEELGMTSVDWESKDEMRDVEAINHTEELIAEHDASFEELSELVRSRSRDNGRTPMQWRDAESAGFTDGDPWIKVNDNYDEINAAAAREDPDSIFHYYRTLIDLRSEHDVVVYGGGFELLFPEDPSVFAHTRTLGEDTLLTVLNWSDEEPTVKLPADLTARKSELLVANYPVDEGLGTVSLRPYEARVYKLT